MGELLEAVRDMSERTIAVAREILQQEGRVNSGDFIEGLTYEIRRVGRGGRIVSQIYVQGPAEEYAAFVEFGVNGTSVRHGSPFSFRGANIAQGPIVRWLKGRGIRLRDTRTGRFVVQNDKNYRRAAFAIGRSIARRGLPPTRAIERAVREVSQIYVRRIDEAAIARIEQRIKKININ